MKTIQLPRRFVRHAWGGTETVVLETSKRLGELGHDTEIFCLDAMATEAEDSMDGVRIRRFPYLYPYLGLDSKAKEAMDGKGGNAFSFSLMRALKSAAGVELIHLHTGKRIGGIGRHVARRRGIPYVISLHGGVYDVPPAEAESWTTPTRGSWEWGRALGWWVGSRRVLDDAAAILCVGGEERRMVQERFPDKRVEHLPNGVDPERFRTGSGERFRNRHSIPEHARVVLTVGRVDVQKGQLLGVGALHRLLDDAPNAHMVLVGPVTNPEYGRQIRDTASERGIADHLTLIPGVDPKSDELADAYAAADVFFLPSTHEPFGIVILEAWTAGLPVVASRVGGIPSLVSEGTNGLLFESGNEAEAAGQLRSLLADEAKRTALGAAGLKTAANEYGWERITARLGTIYEEIVHACPIRK